MTCERCQALQATIETLRVELELARGLADVFARLAERRRVYVPPAEHVPIPKALQRKTSDDRACQARDRAILGALLAREDGLTPRELAAAMPAAPELSSDQRHGAYRNAVARLERLGLVRRERDRFYLTSDGEVAALLEE